MDKSKVYVVVAYRSGRLEEHNYIVAATNDRSDAIAAAREEQQGRGLKYGVEVIEHPTEERIAYFPSYAEPADATRPESSSELVTAHYIGEHILHAFQTGERTAPSGHKIDTPGGPVDTLTFVPAEFPAWIVELCRHALEMFSRGR